MLEREDLFDIALSRRESFMENHLTMLTNGEKLEEEKEEKYLPSPDLPIDRQGFIFDNLNFSGQLNFHYTLADGGTGQDWVVSTSISLNVTLTKIYNNYKVTLEGLN